MRTLSRLASTPTSPAAAAPTSPAFAEGMKTYRSGLATTISTDVLKSLKISDANTRLLGSVSETSMGDTSVDLIVATQQNVKFHVLAYAGPESSEGGDNNFVGGKDISLVLDKAGIAFLAKHGRAQAVTGKRATQVQGFFAQSANNTDPGLTFFTLPDGRQALTGGFTWNPFVQNKDGSISQLKLNHDYDNLNDAPDLDRKAALDAFEYARKSHILG